MKSRLLWFIMLMSFLAFPQKTTPNLPQGPSTLGQLTYKYVPSIKEQIKNETFIYADPISDSKKMGRPRLTHGNKVILGKGSTGDDVLVEKQIQTTKSQTRSPSLVFTVTTSTATPSDPTGAVGLNHYIASWNSSFRIFNKDGTPAIPAASLITLFGSDLGDPIVLYDAAADRFIITEFSDNPNGFHVAVSETNDPVNGGWHIYNASGFQTGTFPDYTKFSIWSDAYYVTANINGGNGNVWALERDQMLNGASSAGIQAFTLPGISTNGFYSPQAFNVTDDNLPAAGNATIVYMQDDAWVGVSSDHLKLWNLDIDWTIPANSTISAATELPVTPFTGVFDGGAFDNLSQPTGGSDIDCIQATIMNQAQFRKFGGYNSALFNFVVDADTSGNEIAAVRWYELRQSGDGQPWSIYQEGTYVAPEGRHAWVASMAMDGLGNIGMGYTTMGGDNNTLITSAYTGQFAGAPSGVMNAEEEFIQTSTGGSNSERYADYSHLTLDPSDDATFWFNTELFTPSRSNVVGVFQLTTPDPDDVGITGITAPNDDSLTASESITVNIRNFGSNDKSNITVRYTIDGSAAVEELYTETIAAGATASYTFTTTADLSIVNQAYTILAYTELIGDTNTTNDSSTKIVTNTINYCEPEATSSCVFDGIKRFVLGTIDTDNGFSGCNSTGDTQGYVDRTELTTDLDRTPSTNPYLLQAQHNYTTNPTSESLSVWIDFNNNGTFETSERLISGQNFTVANQLDDFDLHLPANAALGLHILRIKAIDVNYTGNILEPCTNFSYGEVHDYTVNIIDSSLSMDDFNLNDAKLSVITKPNNQFDISFTTPYTGKLTFNLYNILGQQVVFNVIDKGSDGAYTYDLDMSYASSGVYIIKVGRGNNFETRKIIVK